MSDLAINLLASAIAGIAVWLYQRIARYRKVSQNKAFFGLTDSRRCVINVSRRASSPAPDNVHRRDLAAIVEVATTLGSAGAEVELAKSDHETHGVGSVTEFCVGGPHGNERVRAHLRQFVPGFSMGEWPENTNLAMNVGAQRFERIEGREEYALLIRISLAGKQKPIWVICGQVAIANQAAARFLRKNSNSLRRRYGANKSFCIALQVVDSNNYGYEHVVEVADCTLSAFHPSPAA